MAGSANPARRLPGPKATEILAWAEQVEASAVAASKAIHEEAQIVYLGLRNSGKLPAGVDKLLAARRMRKHLLKAADTADGVAKYMRGFRHGWLGTFGDPNSIRNRKRRGIDVDN